ncbi:hypothetical protein FH972_025828 [Carpinus fangiana]|uniref:Uncharacterized protein n=1 Tax=Carpinus fangiana TaxID=176857 RepID=A0A5N6L2I8_9ROSI|nr:hypothetical protein FH972_025828 [Carpinus fangiana]
MFKRDDRSHSTLDSVRDVDIGGSGRRQPLSSWLRRKRSTTKMAILTVLLVFMVTFYNSTLRRSPEPNIYIPHPHDYTNNFAPAGEIASDSGESPPIHKPFTSQHDDMKSTDGQPADGQPAHSALSPSSPPSTSQDAIFPNNIGQEPSTVKPTSQHTTCQSISTETLAELQMMTEPSVTVISPHQVASSNVTAAAPAPICILVTIPQTPLPKNNYTDSPVPGRGPDTIHLYLKSTDVLVTFPPLNPLPGQPEASSLYTTKAKSIVYYAETVLYTAGVYEIVAEQEFAHWYWAQEWTVVKVIPSNQTDGAYEAIINTSTGVPGNNIYETHAFRPRQLPSALITVSGNPAIPSRPPCSNILNAGVGRWYKQSSFPTDLSQEMTDEWGFTWQGDHCHLSYFTPAETIECFQDKKIHFFGDSMIRRLLKAVVSGGKWCNDLQDDCQDADDGEDGLIDTLDYDSTTKQLVTHSMPRGMHFQHPDTSPISFGRNSSVHFSFLTQLANWPGYWMDRLYDASDLVVLKELGGAANNETRDRAIKPASFSRARPPPESGAADLLVIGFGAWDQAFTDRFDDYEDSLAEFRDAFITAYSSPTHKTPIIMRMSNSWCCRDTASSFRRYTGGRICEFDARTKKVFQYENGGVAVDGRIMVIDPINMNGRPEVLQDYPPSVSNHPRASHVRLEMQMFMNSVCTRDEKDGRVSLRGA